MDVKRVSYGKIFRHSKDTIDPFGFRVDHHKARNTVIPHNATTIGGGSGSPVLNKETGHVLAIHFGGAEDPTLLGEAAAENSEFEKANFAMPMTEIFDALPAEIQELTKRHVMPITT